MDTVREEIMLTIIYDNDSAGVDLKTGWGFACLVEGLERKILFDTGGDGQILLSNMTKLGIAPKSIDAVILSHKHRDHVGGLANFLDACGKAIVYMLASFPESIKDIARYQGSEVIEVRQPVSICPHASSIGEMGSWMRVKEQALVISTEEGSILLTGCAHPGIVNIVERSKEVAGADLLALIGGFHLHYTTSWIQRRVIMRLKQLEVRFVAPCHCSGDRAQLLCQKVFGEGFIRCGVGQVIRSSSLVVQ